MAEMTSLDPLVYQYSLQSFDLCPQEPAREVMKGPIPAEHVPMQETFDGLVLRCRNTANNPVSRAGVWASGALLVWSIKSVRQTPI